MTFDIVTTATWVCRECSAQKTYTGSDAQVQATASGLDHMRNEHSTA
ncbi:MAG TPA: hypothetical protein VFX25_14795 [Streptosporangiaceae bacterium]|nr:hypothetical protein [Streptosporangiaceae bacterium]